MKNSAPIVAALALVLSFASVLDRTQASPAARPKLPEQKAQIEVQVNLVSILASVLDPNGRPVLDLPKDAFEIYEEGVQQHVERFEAETNRPLDLVLMMDTSASAYKELHFEGEAAAHFIRQVVRTDDRLSVFQFTDTVTQLSEFSGDVPALQAAARRVTSGGGTSLYDAVFLGAKALARRVAERRRVIVLVTDAGETTSVTTFDETRRYAILSGALLYTILVRPVKNENGRNTAGEHALETITDSTGGAIYYADELNQLDAMFDRIDRELRTQYLLGYYANPPPPPGSYRRVELKVKGGYTLHYRKGYFAGGSAR
jgi:Ca-activated chloride channel family protein